MHQLSAMSTFTFIAGLYCCMHWRTKLFRQSAPTSSAMCFACILLPPFYQAILKAELCSTCGEVELNSASAQNTMSAWPKTADNHKKLASNSACLPLQSTPAIASRHSHACFSTGAIRGMTASSKRSAVWCLGRKSQRLRCQDAGLTLLCIIKRCPMLPSRAAAAAKPTNANAPSLCSALQICKVHKLHGQRWPADNCGNASAPPGCRQADTSHNLAYVQYTCYLWSAWQ